MTNRIIKKSHFAKSKILLVILCLFGLAFSYSCNCRNNSTAPGDGGNGNGVSNDISPTLIPFTASADAMNNHLDLYVQSDNKTNSVVIIKFKSDQNINSAKITSIKHKSGTEVGLTTDNLNYNLKSSELELGANENTRKTIASKLTTEGETSVITLTMELTSNDEKLENKTTTVDVDVNLIKALKLTDDKVHEMFKKIENNNIKRGYDFDFSHSTRAKYNNEKIEVQNKSDRAKDEGTITPASFVNEMLGSYGFEKPAVKELGYISSAKFDDISNINIDGSVATFFVTFTFNPKYEPTHTRFQLNIDAAYQTGEGGWDKGTTK